MSGELFGAVVNEYSGDVISGTMVESLARLVYFDYKKVASRGVSIEWKDAGEFTRNEFLGYARAILNREPINPKR